MQTGYGHQQLASPLSSSAWHRQAHSPWYSAVLILSKKIPTRGNRHVPGCRRDRVLIALGVTTGKCSLAPRCRAQKWQFFHLHQPLPRPEGQAAWKCHPGAPTSLSNGTRCPHIPPWDRVGGTENRGTGRGQDIPLWQGKCFTHGGEMAPRRARGSPTLQKGVTRGRGGGRGGSVVTGAPQQHQQPWHPLILAHRGGGGEARSCYFL